MTTSTLTMSSYIGNQRLIAGLDRAVAEGRVNHAYLLHGPGGVGKSTLAKWLAARLNCTGDPAPCGACASCRRIARGADPCVRLLQAVSEREPELGLPIELPTRSTRSAERAISIDLVREMQRDASLTPNDGRWKVYLIPGAENLSLPAANCLLKTLEEPPPSVVLILTAVDPEELLPTVISRCQSLRLAPVPPDEIAVALEGRGQAAPEGARLLARLSGGRPGWAIQAATDARLLEERQAALAELEAVHGTSLRERLSAAERLAGSFSKEPGRVYRTLAAWQSWWWDVSLIQLGLAEQVTNLDQRAALERAAGQVPRARVRAYLARLSEGARWLVQNVNPRLALEATVLTAPALP